MVEGKKKKVETEKTILSAKIQPIKSQDFAKKFAHKSQTEKEIVHKTVINKKVDKISVKQAEKTNASKKISKFNGKKQLEHSVPNRMKHNP